MKTRAGDKYSLVFGTRMDDDDRPPSPPPPAFPSGVLVRLYVGGIPADVTEQELTARFTSFGAVTACETIAAREGFPPPSAAVSSSSVQHEAAGQLNRGFAYINLQPKDDHSVSKCLSLVSIRIRIYPLLWLHP